MKKFVVTGGSGFIGSNLIKYLLAKKYFVINVDKLNYSAHPHNLKKNFHNKNYIFFKTDNLFNIDSMVTIPDSTVVGICVAKFSPLSTPPDLYLSYRDRKLVSWGDLP